MEEQKQQIYELKRSLEVERANNEYISSELESVQSIHEQQRADLLRKHGLELDKVRARMAEQEESLQAEIRSLKQQLETAQNQQLTRKRVSLPRADVSDTNLDLEHIQELNENLNEVREEVIRLTNENGQLKDRLDIASEKIECLEQNLQNKRDEVAERDQSLEQFHDTIQELRAELMQFQADPDPDCNKKGNSLFAEVIDQRQQVVHILGAQNRSFKEMKRAYRQSETEIRQLKEENALMVRELGKIKTIFLGANRSHETQMAKRMAELQSDLERWRNKALFLESQVTDGKVSSVLEFFRTDTDHLLRDLNESRLQKCEMNDLLHAAQEELAQWRFQCLKQKCILIDREMRLEANNIPFESRCAVAVDEMVHVSVDDWQDDAEKMNPSEMVLEIDDSEEEEGLRVGVDVDVSSVTDPDVEVSIIKLPGEEGYKKLLEIKAEPSVSPDVATEEIRSDVATFPKGEEGGEGEKPKLKTEDSEEVFIVAAAATQNSFIDLCATIDVPDVNVKKELMDASVDGFATRKASNVEFSDEPSSGPINFDFLLDSPNKPQRHPSTAITPMRMGIPAMDSEDKENQGRKRNTVTKLNYKPISNSRKSILVKRVGLTENQHKNVHFAADVKEMETKKDLTAEGQREANSNDRPKKKMTVNIRTIHSRPPRTDPKVGNV